MAYILVANAGYAGPTEIGGQTYTVVTESLVLVSTGDTVLIDDAKSGSVTIQPGPGVANGAEVNISFEPSTSTNGLGVQIGVDRDTGARLAVTVDVPAGMDNPNASISTSFSTTSTINVADGARFGSVGGSNNAGAAGAPADASTVNIGANATVRQILNVNNLTIGENATVTSAITGSTRADTFTIGSGVRIGTVINTSGGDDRIILGDNVAATNILAGDGADYIQLGAGVTIPGASGGSGIGIDGGAGSDTLAMTDAVAAQFGLTGQTGFPEGIPFTNPTTTTDVLNFNEVAIVCFALGTLIETDHGAIAVEALAKGDRVVTRDNGLQPIRWIGSRRLSAAELDAAPKLRPIIIRAGALGEGLPSADLMVSPQHRLLVRSRIAQKMFGAEEVLVAARQLCQIEGIDVAEDAAEVEYFHILFDRHEIVISNGAETESLFTGPEALKGVGAAAREEIFAIFPELRERDYTPAAARVMASGRMGRKLAVRHMQNGKPLVC